MLAKKLSDLAKITEGEIFADEDIKISNISTNSKEKNKDLFLALKGTKFDGHKFIDEAIKNGAKAICVSKKVNVNVPTLLVKDTLQAYQAIAKEQLTQSKCFTIGITGSSGKTSIRSILEQIFHKTYSKEQILSTLDNTNNHIGVPTNILRLTPKHKIIILEMGTNHYGEIKTLTSIAPLDIAILTNIGHSHIGNFTNYKQLVDEKLSIFSGLKSNATAVLPYSIYNDNKNSKHLKNKKILTFGEESQAHLTYSYSKSTLKQSKGKINNHPLTTSLTGKHQFCNLTIAYLVTNQVQKIPFNQFEEIAQTIALPSMRMSVIEKDNKTWINDAYNANPESMLATIKWFQEIAQAYQEYYLILGDMLELGEQAPYHHQVIIDYLSTNNLLQRTILIGEQMLKAISKQAPLASFITYNQKVHKFCQTQLAGQSLILLKASRGIQLEKIIAKQ